MLGHLADAITERGYGMFLRKILPPMDDWLTNLIGSQRADGLIVIGQSTEHAALEAIAPSYRPMVVWGGHLPSQSYCTVGTDNVAGAMAAVEHLIQRGRSRIVFVGDPSVPEIGLRYAGYRQAHERAGLLSTAPRGVPAHLTAETAYEAIRAFIGGGERFDALFCATDVIAASALRALGAGRRGRRRLRRYRHRRARQSAVDDRPAGPATRRAHDGRPAIPPARWRGHALGHDARRAGREAVERLSGAAARPSALARSRLRWRVRLAGGPGPQRAQLPGCEGDQAAKGHQ